MTRIAIYASAPLLAAALLLVAAVATRDSSPPPPPLPQPEIVCALPAVTELPPVETVEPAKPIPGLEIYSKLDVCLQQLEKTWGEKMAPVTVEQVRYWVEVEKDPMWLEGSSWWFPLSGEGQPDFPSGIYVSVPIHGTDCGGAIVN